ncbi:hypothetical protein [Cohnella abietis]|uniref:Uncharacterized protein n=1 Tax=Cohnella abietis TaxID=2507935 RepID=A0A3T1D4F9_9BACL|nr:hypothetical protein [Cohnella abietis]BBI32951.1 hypothetical protein KCTCHS21_23500 [Cohnella abietis]
MRRMFAFGVIIVIVCVVLLTGCSVQEAIHSNSSEFNTSEDLQEKPEGTKESLIDPPSSVKKELSNQLKGTIEDEFLRVNINAEIDADKLNYKTYIEFSNKSEKSLHLVYDCGLLISNKSLTLTSNECLAVESMLLQKNKKETQTATLPKDFFDVDNKSITVSYRQDNITKELEIQMKAVE